MRSILASWPGNEGKLSLIPPTRKKGTWNVFTLCKKPGKGKSFSSERPNLWKKGRRSSMFTEDVKGGKAVVIKRDAKEKFGI